MLSHDKIVLLMFCYGRLRTEANFLEHKYHETRMKAEEISRIWNKDMQEHFQNGPSLAPASSYAAETSLTDGIQQKLQRFKPPSFFSLFNEIYQ